MSRSGSNNSGSISSSDFLLHLDSESIQSLSDEDNVSVVINQSVPNPVVSDNVQDNVDEDNDLCNKQLTCGYHHKCRKPQNHPDKCGAGNCPFVRMYIRECGHKIVDKCIFEFSKNLPTCEKICGKTQKCSHDCERPCYACDGKCGPLDCDRCQAQWDGILSKLNKDYSEEGCQQASSIEDYMDSSAESDGTDYTGSSSEDHYTLPEKGG